jgi:hypothetical protein
VRRVEESAHEVQLSSGWYPNFYNTNSNSRAVLAIDAGTRAVLQFAGTAVRWIGRRDRWSGIARVYVDDVLKAEIDSYSDIGQAQSVLFSIQGLAAGSHKLTVEVTGRRNPAAASAWIWIDAFDISVGPIRASRNLR